MLLRTPSLSGSSKNLLLTVCAHSLGPFLPPNPASPGGSQAGPQVPQDGTQPQSEEQQPNNPVAASGQSRLSHLIETCPIFPLFSPAEHFLAVEPKWYLPTFWKTSEESKAGKRCITEILGIFAVTKCSKHTSVFRKRFDLVPLYQEQTFLSPT